MLVNILFFGTVVERLWEYLQQIIPEQYLTKQVKLGGATVLGVVVSASFSQDLVYALEITSKVTVPGIVFTGLVISLGSNVVHDLVGWVNRFKHNNDPLGLEDGLNYEKDDNYKGV